MKKLSIHNIESCHQCPFSTHAEFKIEVSTVSVRYCKRMGLITNAPTPLAMLEKLASFAVGQNIPDWCPLEDEQDPADVYAKILNQKEATKL